MIDSIKVGQFIQEERKKKKLTQDELADMLYISRAAISKWERGLSLPDYASMINLCKIFNLTSNELLAGERLKKENEKEINDLPINILKREKKKIKKIFLIFFIIIILLILLFFSLYFFNTYKKVEVYSLYGADENFKINNSNAFITNDETYINLGNIETDKEITKLTLYYLKEDNTKKEMITNSCQRSSNCSPSSFCGSLTQIRGGDAEYFTYEDILLVKENLYVDITYYDNREDKEAKNATIKLDFSKMYTNNNLFFFYEKEYEGEPIIEDKHYQEELLEIVLKEGFEKEETTEEAEHYFKKYNKYVKVKFYTNPEIITVEDEQKEEGFVYFYTPTYNLSYFSKKDGNILNSSTMSDEEITCDSGDCSNHQKYYNYYIENYIEPLLNKIK